MVATNQGNKMKNFPTKTVGNASARPGKRETFMKHKEERSGLADSINNAMSKKRKIEDHVDEKLEGVRPIVKPKKFSK